MAETLVQQSHLRHQLGQDTFFVNGLHPAIFKSDFPIDDHCRDIISVRVVNGSVQRHVVGVHERSCEVEQDDVGLLPNFALKTRRRNLDFHN